MEPELRQALIEGMSHQAEAVECALAAELQDVLDAPIFEIDVLEGGRASARRLVESALHLCEQQKVRMNGKPTFLLWRDVVQADVQSDHAIDVRKVQYVTGELPLP